MNREAHSVNFSSTFCPPERFWQFFKVLIKCAYTALFLFKLLKSCTPCTDDENKM